MGQTSGARATINTTWDSRPRALGTSMSQSPGRPIPGKTRLAEALRR